MQAPDVVVTQPAVALSDVWGAVQSAGIVMVVAELLAKYLVAGALNAKVRVRPVAPAADVGLTVRVPSPSVAALAAVPIAKLPKAV